MINDNFMSTIYILWLRQLKRYFRSKTRMIGSLGQPLLFLVALGFGFGPIYQKAGGGNYLQFLAPGVIAMGILFTSVFMGIEIIWDRQFGFLKETLVAPVSRISIMVGRTLGGATVATFQGIIVFLLSLAVGFRPASWLAFPVALLFMFLIAVLFTALGTAIASFMEDMHGFQLIMNFLVFPIFGLSGALFPISSLPGWLKSLTYLDPLTYGVEGVRYGLLGAAQIDVSTSLVVIFAFAVAMLLVGGYRFRKIRL